VSVAVVVVVPAGPGEAWSRWSDVGGWPDWNPECVAADVDGPAGVGTVLDLTLRHPRSGREFLTRPRVTETVPGRVFAWEARGLGLRAGTHARFLPEPDGTRIDLVAETTGPMAFTYRMTMTDRTIALLYTRMLDALVEDLRP
jgi:hypothetical protein